MRKWRLLIAVLTACVALLAACTPAPSDSGIRGLVTIGPVSPVERPGVPNEAPYAATLVIRDGKGMKVATVKSGEDGRFEVNLAPGSYVVEPQTSSTPPTAQPQTVEVTAHRFTDVRVDYDSGIR